jgi:hypothetical protein
MQIKSNLNDNFIISEHRSPVRHLTSQERRSPVRHLTSQERRSPVGI